MRPESEGNTMMNRRHLACALGAAAVGAALLPVAVALADEYTIVADPNSAETITGFYGLDTTPPAVDVSAEGYQLFDVTDTTLGTTVGTFEAAITNASDASGDSNQELLVTQDLSGTVGTAAGDVPPVGSVVDAYSSGDGTVVNLYSDVTSATGANTVTDTLETPLGNIALPITFDAAAVPSVGPVPVAGGYDVAADPASAFAVTAINGLPPVDVAVEGSQPFDVDGPDGSTVGTFDAYETNTTDIAGTYTQALLVTQDVSGAAGIAAGDVPPVGSVFNTMTLGDLSNYYSDLTSTTGGADTITDTLVTPFGSVTIPTAFDAAALPQIGPVTLGDGYSIVADPGSTETFTGINGLPPISAAVQGSQAFDVDNAAGTVVGSFDADETTAWDAIGDESQTLLVTQDLTGTAGTAAGDVPPVGSVIDTYTFAGSGVEIIYTDLASTAAGAGISTETVVTAFGDLTVPDTFDTAASLASDLFAG